MAEPVKKRELRRSSNVSYAIQRASDEESSEEDAPPAGKQTGAAAKRKRAAPKQDDFGSDYDAGRDSEEEDDEVSVGVATGSSGSDSDGGGSASDGSDGEKPAIEDDDEGHMPAEEKIVPKKQWAQKAKVIPVLSAEKAAIAKRNAALPPIHVISDIFADIVERRKEQLTEFAKDLNGRSIRVATMCSGTESPLLALDQITRALKTLTGEQLAIEHVFSCEIVAFKQAYIERNFSPPLLFRDVEELGNDEAHTAYAGLAKVPGDIDVLIAGTSCVDFSALNNKAKGIDAQGQSGTTFRGMINYVAKNQPPIVILENVSGAPWAKVVEKFKAIRYSAEYTRLDTKKFYIPHTRVRGYLVATRMADPATDPAEWKREVQVLERPATSPLEAFLLNPDDPRIANAREELAVVNRTADGARRSPVDWARCEVRHAQARYQEELGSGRPLTAWVDGGNARLLDGGWTDWITTQTERVYDLIDISGLREAKSGVDISYKTAIWNLSQNVDRNTSSSKLGIAPCLTPSMIPYLTNRGGPVTGLEALSLQGIPIDELHLTRESGSDMADLAGNAMSSTVVGSAILAALLGASISFKKRISSRPLADVDMDQTQGPAVSERIHGELQAMPLDLVGCALLTPEVLELAASTSRKCVCEGRIRIQTGKIFTCSGCLHSSCEGCMGRPVHTFVEDTCARTHPDEFTKQLLQTLPMRFSLDGFDLPSLELQLLKAEGVASEHAEGYIKAVAGAVDSATNEFHFQSLIRRATWVAQYASTHAVLELHFLSERPEWRLFVTAERSLSCLAPLRRLLDTAVGRLKIAPDSTSLLAGQWELRLPLTPQTVLVTLKAVGDLVPTWEANLGLVKFQDQTRAKTLEVTCADFSLLDEDISGTYELQELCGTATQALHKRTRKPDLFFFLDPSRADDPAKDSFVFASDCARLDYGAPRSVVAALAASWRPNDIVTPQLEEVVVSSKWVSMEVTSTGGDKMDIASASTYSIPTDVLSLAYDTDACSYAELVLSARVNTSQIVRDGISTSTEWEQIDLLHQGVDKFKRLSWILARIPAIKALEQWQPIENSAVDHVCQSCCPAPPLIEWTRNSAGWMMPGENGIEAAEFERALKSRPAPIVVQVRQVDEFSEFRIGLNVATLTHKALDALPKTVVHSFSVSAPTSTWRLVTANGYDLASGKGGTALVKFKVTGNINNAQTSQPPGFRVALRPEQLRSLDWMIRQETSPQPWVEEEVAEAALPQLGWHAEAKASRTIKVRGGVLADEVGYGKTVITVGLICQQKDSIVLPTITDRVAIKATLVIVPGHLFKQWPSEIDKFCTGLNVLTIGDYTRLKALTIQDFQEADVIVTSFKLFTSAPFWIATGDFAGGSRPVNCASKARYFQACVDDALANISAQVARLQDPEQGPKAIAKDIKRVRAERKAAAAAARKQDALGKQTKMKQEGKPTKAKQDTDSEDDDGLESDKPAAKKQRTGKGTSSSFKEPSTADPWGLESSEVVKDWTQMNSPPLMMFCFDRIVVDEFTYLNEAEHTSVLSLRSSSRWILSGTPPLDNFAKIKTIALLLHVNLGGADDERESTRAGAAKGRNEQTSAERFHSYREVHTAAWHQRRNEVAQRFLDQYVRQNWAEIDLIKYSEEIVPIELSAAERAIYCELEHYLLCLDENLSKLVKVSKEKKGDREVRLAEGLGMSSSPEEALLKRCSHFSSDMAGDAETLDCAPNVCTQIVARRQAQLDECRAEFVHELRVCAAMHVAASKKPDGLYCQIPGNVWQLADRPLLHVLASLKDDEHDADASLAFHEIVREAKCVGGDVQESSKSSKTAEFVKWSKMKEKTADDRKDKVYAIRNQTALLRKLAKELIGRFRSKRYFEGVRAFQLNEIDPTNNSILSCCGHYAPTDDLKRAAVQQKCLADGCSAGVRTTNVVDASALGVEADSGRYGVKLETLVQLVKAIPEDDRILVFVQFEEIRWKVQQALEDNGIAVATLTGSTAQQSNTLSLFQDETATDQRVLLLDVTNVSASGANLTVANWAFFVSPMLTETTSMYTANETQAIGRLRRYGQAKPVKIFRLLTLDTIDVTTYESRTGTNVNETVALQVAAGTTLVRVPLPPSAPLPLRAAPPPRPAAPTPKASKLKDSHVMELDEDEENQTPVEKEKKVDKGKGKKVDKVKRPPAPPLGVTLKGKSAGTKTSKVAVVTRTPIGAIEKAGPSTVKTGPKAVRRPRVTGVLLATGQAAAPSPSTRRVQTKVFGSDELARLVEDLPEVQLGEISDEDEARLWA